MYKRCLVIQLGNEYDNIYFTGLYKYLYSQQYRLTLLTRKSAKSIVPFFDQFDRILFYDKEKLQKRLKDLNYSSVEKYNFVNDYLYEILSIQYDVVINLSHSMEAARIAALVSSSERVGLFVNDRNRKIISGDWFQLFFASVNVGKYNSFSFYDLLKLQFANIDNMVDPYLLSDSSLNHLYEKIEKRFDIKGKELVLLSCASKFVESDRWDIKAIVELAKKISARGEKLIIFSGPEGVKTLRKVESYLDGNIVCEVMTALDLILFMKYTKLFVSQSMPSMAVPASFGVPIISLEIREDNFREASSLPDGSFVIETNDNFPDPEFIFDVFDYMCSNTTDKKYNKIIDRDDIPVFPPENLSLYLVLRDSDGFLGYLPLRKKKLSREEFYRELYREMWKYLLCSKNITQAIEKFTQALKYNYFQHDINSALTFAKYDMDVISLCQEYNRVNINLCQTALQSGDMAELLFEVKRNQQEILSLFTKNSFMHLIKFYFLINYEEIMNRSKSLADQGKGFYKFSLDLEKLFSFMEKTVRIVSENIFDDQNLLDEVISAEESVVYH